MADDRFTVIVEVSLSPPFYGWVFQFGGDIRILSLKKAVNEMLDMTFNYLETDRFIRNTEVNIPVGCRIRRNINE